jgi:N-methylhydantoinase B
VTSHLGSEVNEVTGEHPTGSTELDYDPVEVEIMWNRLGSMVDEASSVLIRSSFSPVVREANDFACVLMDAYGRSLAESTLSVPCFNATLPVTMTHFLKRFPANTWRPGDIVITNDPWLGTGHLPDFTIATSVFVGDELVGFAGTIAHLSDIGGTLIGADTKEVFEEGLFVPIMRLASAGKINEDLIDILKANVRVPEYVMGDLYAQIAAVEVLAQRLQEMVLEQGAEMLTSVAEVTQRLAEATMRRAIKKIPDGIYHGTVVSDGYDEPLKIEATVSVHHDEITVDYAGSSSQLAIGAINSPLCYTYAYTAYPIKCAIDPYTPKNDGSFRPIRVTAPEGTIVNPTYPAAVNARHLTGQLLSAAVYGALADVIPDKVIAESGGAPIMCAMFSGVNRDGKRFSEQLFAGGGMGARPDRDGLHCTAFPSNSTVGSLEIHESMAPLVCWLKEIDVDSGGAGRFRGGCGQRFVIQVVGDKPVTVSFRADRLKVAAKGYFGGHAGSVAKLTLFTGAEALASGLAGLGGRPIAPKGQTRLKPGDVIEIIIPGGGGYGPPNEREHASVLADVLGGLVSTVAARDIYRVPGA